MKEMSNPWRSLLGKQPARLLLIDLTTPFSAEVIDDVCDVLENLYAVACNFCGPSRIPFFSMVVLQDYQKPLLPFSYVKNNFPRIQTAISDVRTAMHAARHANRHGTQFDAALLDACSQYKKQLQPTFQSGGFSLSLEIVVLTCQNEKTVQKQVEVAAASLDLEHIKKIQVLCLMSLDISLEDQLDTSQGSVTSATSHQSRDSVTGLVEMVKLDPDMLYLQNFFNNWLLDTNTDSEHLHLILPSIGNTGSPLVIKCDLHERVLFPAQLPFYHNFTLHSDASAMKIVFPSNSKAMGMTVPIYKLKVTGQVPISSICDSLVFGMPMIAQATSCWKIDWDDLEKHQQNFRALCYTLAKKEQALIAHLLPADNSMSNKYRQNKQPSVHPRGNFVLLPSSTGSLLIKCLAVQELILPYSPVGETMEPAEESIAVINGVLNKVEEFPSYNPHNHPSNLYECLRNKGVKPATQRQQKQKADKTVPCTNKMVTLSNRQTNKQPVVQESARDTDTPLTNKPSTGKSQFTHSKRRLYNQNDTLFMEEPDDFLDDMDQEWNYPNKRTQRFPTSL